MKPKKLIPPKLKRRAFRSVTDLPESIVYRKARRRLVKELGETIFEKAKGNFGLILETHPFLEAKFSLAHALWELNKRVSAIKHGLEILDLDTSDKLGV